MPGTANLPHGEDFAGQLLNPAGDGIAVRRPPGERFEDEQVERALEQLERSRSWHGGSPIDVRCIDAARYIECQWVPTCAGRDDNAAAGGMTTRLRAG